MCEQRRKRREGGVKEKLRERKGGVRSGGRGGRRSEEWRGGRSEG